MHRNSQKRPFKENLSYFITIKTKNNYPYFQNKILCELFIQELVVAKEIKKFELYAFSILYDHVHIILKPDDSVANISEIMRSLKTNFSRDANDLIEGAVPGPRLRGYQKSKKLQLIFNINGIAEIFRAYSKILIPLFSWQKSFHDHYIRNLKDFQNHYDYTVTNLHKHNLPVDWKYVSTNYANIIDMYI